MKSFADIHCHIVPGIDDGASDLAESIAMARMAAADGTKSLVATPHQLGGNSHVSAEAIRKGVASLQAALAAENIEVSVLPGADVRIEPELPKLLKQGKVLTLADRGKHVLLELPHDTYIPLEQLFASLDKQGLVGILSHPERNRGIIRSPDVMKDVVAAGGLLQITAGSLTGAFGSSPRRIAEYAIKHRVAHFIASDAHDTTRRPFGLSDAFATVASLADETYATLLCCGNPAKVVNGDDVVGGVVRGERRKKTFGSGWFRKR
ncbi:MAG: tyrosine-protein phosphatase [Planctomycetia bacterium]